MALRQEQVAGFLSGSLPASGLGAKGPKAQLLAEVQENVLAIGQVII